jgi:hypothetical protein
VNDPSGDVACPSSGSLAGHDPEWRRILARQRRDGLPIGLPGLGFAGGMTECPEAVQHQIDRIGMVQ